MSLFGGILCLIVMFLIDYITALITFIITIALYLFVSYRKPGKVVMIIKLWLKNVEFLSLLSMNVVDMRATTTPLLHHYYTTTTSLLHHYYTTTTSLFPL